MCLNTLVHSAAASDDGAMMLTMRRRVQTFLMNADAASVSSAAQARKFAKNRIAH